jgi:hypothetical protein
VSRDTRAVTAEILARLPITFDCADGTMTHAPMILTSVGGAAPARYILDSGSEVHLLNEDLVDELQLPKVPGEEGVDHAGNTMPSWTVGDVPINLGDFETVLRNCFSIPAPAVFPPKGIRGILSPQALHAEAWVVVDLAGNELLLLIGSNDEAAGYLRGRSADFQLLTLARDANFPSLVVPAALDGYEAIPTLLNTGGKSTEYGADVVADLTSGEQERLGGGVSGADYAGWSVGAHSLKVNGASVTLPKLSVRPQMHDTQAIVGMDALAGTVLAFANDLAKPVFWLVPG